jgi:hypothetical protein
MRRCAACVAVAIAVASPHVYGGWSVVASTTDYFVEFDPDLVRRQGTLVMAWMRLTFTAPQQGANTSAAKYQSQLQLHAIDCATMASTVVGLVSFTGALGRGEEIERTTRPRAQWTPQPAPPGTLSDVTIRLACGQSSQAEKGRADLR